MDYEKKYKEALEKARQLCAYPTTKPFISDLQDLFPELKESEDERIRKTLIAVVNLYYGEGEDEEKTACLYWLEKQGEYKKFRDSIQVGDKVTRNEEGVLVNLSQLNRVAKKQGEQKPVDCDESVIDETISLINKLASGYGEKVDEPITFNGVKMINNIKERLRAIKPQPKQEWSEKDEKIKEGLINSLAIISANTRTDSTSINYTFSREIDWLKSLRPQSKWKPTEEQVEALGYAIKLCDGEGEKGRYYLQFLYKLMNDFKAL